MSQKPEGQATRGFTAPNRLRLVDTYVLVALPGHLRSFPGLFADVGYGMRPVTTIESFERFRRVNPHLRAVGVEIDPARVAAAQPYRREGLDFRMGGFNLPLTPGEQPGLVRAFNVLRQYPESDIRDALWSLAHVMPPGAILLEGTTDPLGRHVCFWVWTRDGTVLPPHIRKGEPPLQRKWLVFGARLHAAFSPRGFQPFLPKELIHHAEPGGTLDAFFAAWERGWASAAGRSPKERWFAGAGTLASAGYAIDRRRAVLSRSLIAVSPGGLVAPG
jgi:hypothetical protein